MREHWVVVAYKQGVAQALQIVLADLFSGNFFLIRRMAPKVNGDDEYRRIATDVVIAISQELPLRLENWRTHPVDLRIRMGSAFLDALIYDKATARRGNTPE